MSIVSRVSKHSTQATQNQVTKDNGGQITIEQQVGCGYKYGQENENTFLSAKVDVWNFHDCSLSWLADPWLN
jgi:hypothetical protein